jgi:hypothetical protein
MLNGDQPFSISDDYLGIYISRSSPLSIINNYLVEGNTTADGIRVVVSDLYNTIDTPCISFMHYNNPYYAESFIVDEET